MPFTLTMPKLSPTMVEGTIAKWFVKEGEFIEAGQLLMEVATDKATVEYNAIDEGYLRKLLVSEGDEAHVNQPIAIFTAEEKEEIKDYTPEGEAPKKEAPEPAEDEGHKVLSPMVGTFYRSPSPEAVPSRKGSAERTIAVAPSAYLIAFRIRFDRMRPSSARSLNWTSPTAATWSS